MMQQRPRQLPNYLLPTEAKEALASTVGLSIVKVKTGTWMQTVEEILTKRHLQSICDLVSFPHGGPLFLSFGEGSTYTFRSDEFLWSIVFRTLPIDMDAEGFLEELYKGDDYVWPSMRSKIVIDLSPCVPFLGERIASVRVLTLPDNYYSTPKYGWYVHETAVAFRMEDRSEFLIANGVVGNRRSAHAILTWDQVPEDFPVADLQEVFRHPVT